MTHPAQHCRTHCRHFLLGWTDSCTRSQGTCAAATHHTSRLAPWLLSSGHVQRTTPGCCALLPTTHVLQLVRARRPALATPLCIAATLAAATLGVPYLCNHNHTLQCSALHMSSIALPGAAQHWLHKPMNIPASVCMRSSLLTTATWPKPLQRPASCQRSSESDTAALSQTLQRNSAGR
jgi:hypothetical protein